MTKTIFATLVLTLAPAVAFAEGCSGSHAMQETASISCAEGTTHDAETNTCVPLITG